MSDSRPLNFWRGVVFFFAVGLVAYPIKFLSVWPLGLTAPQIQTELLVSTWGFHLPISLFGFVLAIIFLRVYPTPKTETRFLRWAWGLAIAVGLAFVVLVAAQFQLPSYNDGFGDSTAAQYTIVLVFGMARTVIAVAIGFWLLFLPWSKNFIWPLQTS